MPRPHPPEFRRRAVELARERAKPVSEIARDLGISDSCLRNWMVKADIEDGRRDAPNPAAIFEWIECWYNPSRRHSSIGMLSPIDYETRTTAATAA